MNVIMNIRRNNENYCKLYYLSIARLCRIMKEIILKIL